MQKFIASPGLYLLFTLLFYLVTACGFNSGLAVSESDPDSETDSAVTPMHYKPDVRQAPEPDRISLANLESYQTAPDGWNIYGNVYADYPGLPLNTVAGTGILLYEGDPGPESLLQTKSEHKNALIEIEFMFQQDSCFLLMLQSRYAVRLCNPFNTAASDHKLPGTIHYGPDLSVVPIVNAARTSGVWQTLSVDFRAPEFDPSGNKITNARIETLRLNGEVIHRSIELPRVSRQALSQNEVRQAPLALVIESGKTAFRNIGFYHERKIPVSNLHYAYHEEYPEDDRMFAEAVPLREGPATRITATHASRGNNFTLRYEGIMEIPAGGMYRFESIARGEVSLQVNGHNILQPSPAPEDPLYLNLTDRVDGMIELESGPHPFTLQYKKSQAGSPSLSVFVTGPGIKKQPITSHDGAWRSAIQAQPMPVEPDSRAVVFRSHMDHSDRTILNAVSVGDPEKVHYSFDVGNAALLQMWQDTFLDAGPIWTGRGMDPDTRMVATVIIPDHKITFSGRPTIAFLQNESEIWPDSVDRSYRFLGYTNDHSGRPTFTYRLGSMEFHERLRPDHSEVASKLIREISLRVPDPEADRTTGPWILLAEGVRIERRSDGVYSIDDRYFLELDGDPDVYLRRVNKQDELLLKVPASSQPSHFLTTYIW